MYTVKSSEKLRKPGSDAETKALLYLMNFMPDSDEIFYFIVDFFNDLTGMDTMSTKLWDLQSKGDHNVGPKKIGKELVTLFKNYMSEFDFNAYIIFIGTVSSTVCIDCSKNVFDITNIKDSALDKIKAGLIEEGKKKNYISETDLTDENICSFLKKLKFVIDNDKKPSEYVRSIIRNHPSIVPKEETLNAIFNEIRNVQSSKKNNNVVENITIQTSDEALNYSRYLTNNEIRLLTLQRIIQSEIMLKNAIPTSFIDIYNTWRPEEKINRIEECQQALYRVLFNNNTSDLFWHLFERTYNIIVKNSSYNVQQIFLDLNKSCYKIAKDLGFAVLSLKYFIAIVKDGIRP